MATQTLDQIISSRASLYDPQKQLVQQQLDALPGQEQTDEAALDTAKTNAFSDITNSANSKGMLYSGAPIQEQQQYVGEKYLPALANVKATESDNQSKLEQALLGINQNESTAAQSIYDTESKDDADTAYKDEQLALEQEKIDNAAGGANPATGYTRISNGDGLAYRDNHGNPITAAAYYNAKGASGLAAIKADLAGSQNPNDAAIAADIGKLSQAQLIQKYPWVFGG